MYMHNPDMLLQIPDDAFKQLGGSLHTTPVHRSQALVLELLASGGQVPFMAATQRLSPLLRGKAQVPVVPVMQLLQVGPAHVPSS